jgi:hypothetical protein
MVPEGEPVDQYKTQAGNGPDSSRKAERRGKAQHPGQMSDLEATILALSACPRCSYFVAGYRLIHDDLEVAAANLSDGWLTLTGGHTTRKLVARSFGVQIDGDVSFYSGCCRECRRVFSIEQPSETDQPPIMRFRVTG